MPDAQMPFIELAIEHWKLLRAFERSIAFADADSKSRLEAQARYSQGRLDALLAKANLRAVSFDGREFEVNLPAIAINADEVADALGCVVERTIEPAIVSPTGVAHTGRVYLITAPVREM